VHFSMLAGPFNQTRVGRGGGIKPRALIKNTHTHTYLI